LLARLKSNYQLGELVKVENYPEVIRLIANFTVTSLQVQNGLTYPQRVLVPLVLFWHKIITPLSVLCPLIRCVLFLPKNPADSVPESCGVALIVL